MDTLAIAKEDAGLAFLAAYYGAAGCSVEAATGQLSSLTLQSGSTVQGGKTIAEHLARAAEPEALSALEEAQVQQWFSLASTEADAELIGLANTALAHRAFLVQPTGITRADVYVFARLHRVLGAFGAERDLFFRNSNVARWADYLQHQPRIAAAMSQRGMATLAIPLDAPAIDRAKPAEKKPVEKKPAEAAADAKAAPAAAAAAPAKKDKKDKKKKEQPKKEEKPERALDPSLLDLRIGFIERAVKHPDADSLYISTIQCGEDKPRTVVSGLVKYVPLEDMQQRHVVILGNLKPANMRGVKSEAMVLCASNEEHGIVEFVLPPAGAEPGDRVVAEGFAELDPEPVLQPKKKMWEQLQPGLTSTADKVVGWTDFEGAFHKLAIKGKDVGPFCTSTLINATVR